MDAQNKEASMRQFELLFKDLDTHMKKLKISSYGLSDTTLEEVMYWTVLELLMNIQISNYKK